MVELVIFMLVAGILVSASYSGISNLMNKAKISTATSDLHNFSIAVEAALNSTQSVGNASNNGIGGERQPGKSDPMEDLLFAMGMELSADFAMLSSPAESSGEGSAKIKVPASAAGATYVIYETAKEDPWGNPYYIIYDVGERHTEMQSDFYVTVVSAGTNGHLDIGGHMEKDDIFLLGQYMNGEVSAKVYNCASDKIYNHSTGVGVRLNPTEAFFIGGASNVAATAENKGTLCPTNY